MSLAPFTTLEIGGESRFFCEIRSEDELVAAVKEARRSSLPLFVLGGGSNLVVSDKGFDGLTLRIGLTGIDEMSEGGHVLVRAAAGEDWDGLVRYAVDRGYAGIECLAGIPGSVGGTPVQNVGAYGQEVSTTIVRVRAFDLANDMFVELDGQACGFSYRSSIFNGETRGRYIVVSVIYRLLPGGEPALRYADLKKYFVGKTPALREVYEGVREIRAGKGMLAGQGGVDGRSAGSFFKNPVVPVEAIARIAGQAGCGADEVPQYPAEPGKVKLPAAWLVERAGFHKGFQMGRVGISTRHTLALVNLGGATAAELIALRDVVVVGVEQRFGVRLQQEPVQLGA